jgi:hypothetical protein
MLDCWQIQARGWNASWTSLKAFADANPTWGLIEDMSASIVENCGNKSWSQQITG